MKVLHVISSSGLYGAEAVILNLSRILRERGHESELAVFSNSKNPNLQLHECAIAEGMNSYVIPCSGQVDRSAIAAIRDRMIQTKADVMHSHNFKADVYAYFALRRSRAPLVATCHNWIDSDPVVTLYGKIDRIVLRNFARVVAVSEQIAQRLAKSGVHQGNIRSVRNGIDLRPFQDAPPISDLKSDDRPLVGLVGRLGREKGVDVFINAAAVVLKTFPHARFVVIGEGPDRVALERLIHELKIADDVMLLGRRDDMASVYASLDIMVSASRQEGLPMAILEGMASGLPLVATAVGEVPTAVLDGRTGIVVPPENTERLADAIAALLHDPEKRAQMGAAGRQLIRDELSAERMTKSYLQVYEEAVATTSRHTLGRDTT